MRQIAVLLFIALAAMIVSVPCTPPTDNKWGQSQGVLEINTLANPEPKCFSGHTCSLSCSRFLKCKVWDPLKKKYANKRVAVFFDLSENSEIYSVKSKVCANPGQLKYYGLGKNLKDRLLDMVVQKHKHLAFSKAKAVLGRFINGKDFQKRQKAKRRVPTNNQLAKFLSETTRKCNKITKSKE